MQRRTPSACVERVSERPLGLTGPLLTRLAKAYVGRDAEYPNQSQTGYIVRYSIDRIGGVGPWTGGAN